ncbi:related to Beta3 protein (Ruby) [Melanopsichium pennsylvanicum]|uniref:Related to Beta3 protein (Ruby) n=2 Tax=Melanopsichium pennsylvanicum TaxID=63383 RepID=A0AAJ5C5W2_9BASI|nr:related to Beta3 protein (Ruby) [Melanopsichium pennsylvanicum]
MSAAYSNSSRALAYLSETSEDAIAALKGLVGGVGSAKYLDTSEDKLSTIATQIDSSRDEDRIAALTRIVAMISKARDASSFLPSVLKLTSSSNLDVRKLVYIILLRYANNNPDLTLLSINSFQRDLSDPSPLIRAMALRVLSSIKLTMVAPIVIMAVTKAARDPNLYVRKIAALAIPKCYQIDTSHFQSLQDVLKTLLSDRSPFVLGAALSAFQSMCPANWQLIHQNYRKTCHALSDMDEWGQIVALQVLSRYARANLARPQLNHASALDFTTSVSAAQSSPAVSTPETEPTPTYPAVSGEKKDHVDRLEAFLSGDAAASLRTKSILSSNETSSAQSTSTRSASFFDRDLELLLSKSQALLHSRNPAVVLAVARLILYLSPPSDHSLLVRPLVRLLRSTSDIAYVVLLNILSISRTQPHLFAPFVTTFLLGASHQEPSFVSLLKLDVLTLVSNPTNLGFILTELGTHMRSADARIASHAVTCLGELATAKNLDASSKCLAMLLDLLRKKKNAPRVGDETVARAVLVIKNLLQLTQENTSYDSVESRRLAAIVYRLAALLFGTHPKLNPNENSKRKKSKLKVIGKGAILHPEARASILWLLGQHARQSISVSDPTAPPSRNRSSETRTLAELIIPDILRLCAINFSNESCVVKLQILTTSSKAFALLPTLLAPTPGANGRAEKLMERVTVLHFYLLKLARYDAEFDVRDRARFFKGLTNALTSSRPAGGANTGLEEISTSLTEMDSIQASIESAARTIGETASEDDADLKGVRLRREQVIHVLFEGKSVPVDTLSSGTARCCSPNDTVELDTSGPEVGSLSLVLGGKLIKGWSDVNLPPWTTSPTPATLREPPASTSLSLPSLQNTTLSNLKSFSSSDFAATNASCSSTSSPPIVLTPTIRGTATPTSRGSATPIELDSSSTTTQVAQKYKDLDSFLDESDDEEEEQEGYLDDSAPEDDEFTANINAWNDGDEEEEEQDSGDNDDDDEEDEEEEEDDESTDDDEDERE